VTLWAIEVDVWHETFKELFSAFKRDNKKRERALLFVEHIEAHIKNGDDVRVPRNAKVLCKFCNKTIDQIALEAKQ
jgi:hypothetical protein